MSVLQRRLATQYDRIDGLEEAIAEFEGEAIRLLNENTVEMVVLLSQLK